MGVSIIWQMHHMFSTKRKKKMLLSRGASTKHGGSLLAGASMLDALVLARLACAFARAALLIWARPCIRPAVVIACSDMFLSHRCEGHFGAEIRDSLSTMTETIRFIWRMGALNAVEFKMHYRDSCRTLPCWLFLRFATRG